MIQLFYNTLTPIGLDLGGHTIKAVQRTKKRVLSMVLPREADASSEAPLTLEDAKRLRAVMTRQGFLGRDVVIAVPKRSAITSVLELPPRRNGVPIDLIARTELATAHRREPEGLETACWELPEDGRAGEGVSVLAVGCAHEAADAVIVPLESAGFTVKAMDLEAWAVARVCGAGAGSTGIVAVIDMGWTSGTLVLLHAGTVVYERQLSTLGMTHLVGSLQRDQKFTPDAVDYMLYEVGFDAEARGQADDWRLLMKARSQLESHFDALSKEIGLSVRYAQHQYPHATVERAVLTGGGAAVLGLAKFLTPLLDVEVEVAKPSGALGAADGHAIASPLFAIAAGLCLWREGGASRCAA